MEKEVDTNEVKPGMAKLLVFCLFIFFVWVVHALWRAPRIADIFPFPLAPDNRYGWITIAIIAIVCGYSLLSMVLFMKKDRSSVFSMRLSILFLFLLQLYWSRTVYFSPLPPTAAGIGARLSPMIYKLAQFIIILSFPFLVFLFFYIKHSKASKEWVSPMGRRIGWPGWIGLTFIAVFLVLETNIVIRLHNYSRDADVKDDVELNDGEITDGRFAFVPKEGWTRLDDTYLLDSTLAMRFVDANGDSISIFSGSVNVFPRSKFNAVAGRVFLSSTTNNKIKEIVSHDTIMPNVGSVYLSVYEREADSINYLTCSAYRPDRSHKFMMMSVHHTEKPQNEEWIVGFWRSVRSSLEHSVPKQ